MDAILPWLGSAGQRMSASRHGRLSRAAQMARIRGRDTAPEVALRRILWHEGHRYRVHYRTIGGRADVVFPGHRLAIFLDGCFWHGCPDHYVPPRSSRPFWSGKLRQNVRRDRRQTLLLEAEGWQVLRFWEHEVGEDPARVASVIERVLAGTRTMQGAQPRVIQVDFVSDNGSLERQHLEALREERSLGLVVRERSTAKWQMANGKRSKPIPE
jgi:DNA mismatch endonuclease (patch repair protein)